LAVRADKTGAAERVRVPVRRLGRLEVELIKWSAVYVALSARTAEYVPTVDRVVK
jgi:hypothetical protein